MTEAYKTVDPTAPEIEIALKGCDLRGHRGHFIWDHKSIKGLAAGIGKVRKV